MIICRTPYRISFFGGGTDYPAWYEKHGGCVLSTTIDKYCYLSCRFLPPFFEHKSRIVYSKVELVKSRDEIQHPAVREALKFMGIEEGVEIHHDGDLPARTGTGSSSSFSVGLLHALYGLKEIMPTKKQLALDAIHIERDVLKENVGSQDQVAAAFGGLNKINFKPDGTFTVEPVILNGERLEDFQNHLMLFFTGFSRTASEIAKKKIENIEKKNEDLASMRQMVERGLGILGGGNDLSDFGKLLHESWMLKRSLAEGVTTPEIDQIYEAGLNAGAIGGKLIGAGGGGFILFFAKPDNHKQIREKLKKLIAVPFRLESNGSQIVFYRPNRRKTDRLLRERTF
ncbi:MAG TPA: kinase [Candidatus Omnitrophota bacterium]|nr:kinase [Candidatus Omnitrophota bacterium]